MSDNIAQVYAFIEGLKKRLNPNKELMTAIAGEMLASVEDNFRNQGANVPGGWPALSPATIKQKQRKNRVLSILQSQGRMLKANKASATNDTAMVSNNAGYAAIHNYGGTINIGTRERMLRHRTNAKGDLLTNEQYPHLLIFAKKSHKRVREISLVQRAYSIKIPARPFMVLTDHYRYNIIEIIDKHVNSK